VPVQRFTLPCLLCGVRDLNFDVFTMSEIRLKAFVAASSNILKDFWRAKEWIKIYIFILLYIYMYIYIYFSQHSYIIKA